MGPASAASAAPATPQARTTQPTVLTSFLPIHSLARSIGGNRATVENWLPQGIDPHEFQFQPRDLRRLRGADLLIVSGLGLEGWKQTTLREACSNPTLRVVDASAGLPAPSLIHSTSQPHDHGHAPGSPHDHNHDGDSGSPNPHYWLDPRLAAHAATNIFDALVAIDEPGRPIYQENLSRLAADLDALDREFAAALAPVRGIPFVTYHDAFPYLARRYGLNLVGVIEVSAAEEPTPRELARLSALVRERKARVLFIDSTPSRLARRLSSDLGLTMVRLETLETGELRPSAYLDGMRRNLKALVSALTPTDTRR